MDDPYDTIRQWERAFNHSDSATLAALYAPDAVLWGTLARALITSPRGIHDYFIEAAAAGLRVVLGEHVTVRLSETCAADAGHYELSRTSDGAQMLFPARYSIVLVKTDDQWMISHHHSSMLPAALGTKPVGT